MKYLMSKFQSGRMYRHDTGSTLDIKIIKVRYLDKKRSKLLIQWISRTSGSVLIIPGGRMDGMTNVEIKAKDYQYWKVLGISQ